MAGAVAEVVDGFENVAFGNCGEVNTGVWHVVEDSVVNVVAKHWCVVAGAWHEVTSRSVGVGVGEIGLNELVTIDREGRLDGEGDVSYRNSAVVDVHPQRGWYICECGL